MAPTVVWPMTLRRLAHVDARQSRGPLEERVGGNLRAGADDAAQILALRRDRIERRRRAEVGDDQRQPGRRPYCSYAAMLLAIRSAPTSAGRSYRIGMPAFVTGSTTSGSRPK